MKASEIIQKTAIKHGVHPHDALRIARGLIEQQGFHPIKYEDPVMMYKPIANGVASAAFLSGHDHKKLIKDMEHFKGVLKKNGIKRLYLWKQNPEVLSALTIIGMHPRPSGDSHYPMMSTIE